jgi:hypothetical protein
MPSAYYMLAHQVIPRRAATAPAEVWGMLSGPDWSTWLAMASQVMEMPVRGVGVEGVLQGQAIKSRWGVEMLAVYFPEPSGPGEPYYAVIARRRGDPRLRTFVFEKGIAEPGAPPRVVMAEWRVEGEAVMRVRYDESADASAEACLDRAATAVSEAEGQPLPSINAGHGAVTASRGEEVAKAAGPALVLLGLRAALPAIYYVLPLHIPFLSGGLSLVALIMYFVWFAKLYDWVRANRGGTQYTTGLAIGGWFIPLVNLALPYLALRDAWRRVMSDDGGGLVAGWWAAFVISMLVPYLAESVTSLDTAVLIYWGTFLIQITAWGLLALIVQTLTKRVTGRA